MWIKGWGVVSGRRVYSTAVMLESPRTMARVATESEGWSGPSLEDIVECQSCFSSMRSSHSLPHTPAAVDGRSQVPSAETV